jgi:hypothetical protein
MQEARVKLDAAADAYDWNAVFSPFALEGAAQIVDLAHDAIAAARAVQAAELSMP